MFQKAAAGLYKILSWTIWAATMGLLVLITVLLCTGENRAPNFILNSVCISETNGSDEALSAHTATADGWYKAEYDVTVKGASLSPYTYTAASAVYNANSADRLRGTDFFVAPIEKITYSKLNPASFTITLYMKANTIDTAREIAMNANLGLREVEQSFSFFTKSLQMNLPGFSVNSFNTEPIMCTEASEQA